MPTTKPPKLEGFGAEVRDHALTFPEATEDFPWGERAFKVRGKAFVFLGSDDGETPRGVVRGNFSGLLRGPFSPRLSYACTHQQIASDDSRFSVPRRAGSLTQ